MSSFNSFMTLLVLSLYVFQSNCQDIGGGTSVASLISQLIGDYNKAYGTKIPAFQNVNSGVGITNFIQGKYEIGVTLSTLTAAQEATVKSSGKSVGHMPFTLTTISVINNRAGLKLSGCQLADIYLGKIRDFSQIKGSGRTGKIIPLMRESGAAATDIFTSYIKKSCPSWPSKFVGLDSYNTGNPNLVFVKGSVGISSAVSKNDNAIGYVQSNYGIINYGNKEVAVQNRANKYVTAANSDPYQSIPRKLPSTFGGWSGVDLVFAPGAKTFPIAGFGYFLVRGSYVGVPSGKTVINFLKYAFSFKGQNIASVYYFNPLPTKVLDINFKGIKKIKV